MDKYLDLYIQTESNYSEEKINNYLLLIIMYADLLDIKYIDDGFCFSTYLSEMEDILSFIPLKYTDKMIKIITERDIKFLKIQNTDTNLKLFNFIYENNYYHLSNEIIELIIQIKGIKNVNLSEALKTKNYTTIKKSECIHLINRIEEEIIDYIDLYLINEQKYSEDEQYLIELLKNKKICIDDKKSIIFNSNTLISDINVIEDTSLWEYIIENSKIIADWKNIYSYFKESKNEIDSALTNFLNIEVNYIQLSKYKLNQVILESEEIIDNISLKITLCQELNLNSFCNLLQSITNVYTELEFENLSSKKVDYMINSRFLHISPENFKLLKQYFPDKNIKFIEKNIEEFINLIEKFEIDDNDILIIFHSSKFTKEQKFKVIDDIDISVLNDNKELFSIICNYIAFDKNIEVEFEIKRLAIKYASKLENKIKLINNELEFKNIDVKDLELLLNEVGKPYSDITINGLRTKLDNTATNLKLAGQLKIIRYISSYKIINKFIKINTKVKKRRLL